MNSNAKRKKITNQLGIATDVWKYHIAAYLSPLGVTRLRATCDFFRSKINNVSEEWKHLSPNNGLKKAALGGYRDLVDLFIPKGANNWDWVLRGASKGGYQDLVDLFISKGADRWSWALEGASEGGHKNLVNFFISKGANNWGLALEGASKGGHQDLVDFFQEKLNNYQA